MAIVIGINPPAALRVAFLQCVLIQLHSEVAPLKSVSGVFPGSDSPYDNLSANPSRALYVDLVSLRFDALLAAAKIWQAIFLPHL